MAVSKSKRMPVYSHKNGLPKGFDLLEIKPSVYIKLSTFEFEKLRNNFLKYIGGKGKIFGGNTTLH